MKKLISKVVLFLGIFAGIFGFNYGMNNYYIHKYPPIFEEGTIAIGDSHIKSGIDPSIIGNCANIAQPGEPLFITFHKLRKVQQHHKNKLQRVIIGLGYHSVSGLSDTKYNAPDLAPEFTKRSYALIPFREMMTLPLDYRAYTRTLLHNMLLWPKKTHHDYIGGFNIRPHKLAKANAEVAVQRHYMENDSTPHPFSQISIRHLDSIIHFCESQQIELVFVSSPLHPDYIKLVPPSYKEKYAEMRVRAIAKGARVLEFHQRPLPDSHFSDYDHLSRLGADSLSTWVRQALTSN